MENEEFGFLIDEHENESEIDYKKIQRKN